MKKLAYSLIAIAGILALLIMAEGILIPLVFGVVVTWIAVFQGYDTVPTSEGISRATTRTVVYSSLAVLGLDFILTAVMFGEL